MYGGLRYNVCVQAIAKVDRIDIVTADGSERDLSGLIREQDIPFQIAVHNGKEHLEKEVDGVYQYRQKIQPCLA